MEAMEDLVQAIPQLARVPQCAYPAYQALAVAGCGPDLKCICANPNLFATLQGVFAVSPCSPSDAQDSILSLTVQLGSSVREQSLITPQPDAMVNTREICVAAVPWLNDNRGPEITGSLAILIILATIAVVLRFVARHITQTSYGLDDWLMFFALVWEYGLATIFFFGELRAWANPSVLRAHPGRLGLHYGLGRHILMLDLDQATSFIKLFFATTCVFPVACAALKFSILIFYHRIFPFRKFTISCVVIGVAVAAWFIAFIVASFLTCRPLEYFWDKSIPGGQCVNVLHVTYYITSPPDILTNFAILVLPLPWLWNLQMQLRRKLGIVCILALGSFAVFGSVVRIPLMHKLEIADSPWSSVNSGLWLNVEIAIGIVSGSLPLMRPLFAHPLASQFFSRFSRSRVTTGSHRLRDGQQQSDRVSSSRSKGLHSSGIYAGASQQQDQKNWYDNSVSVKALGSRPVGTGIEKEAEEEVVPMGKIQVKHDLEWEQGVPPSDGRS
ncbi:MAG: hypothetical protein Q9210_002615 [Variospora velana]